MAPPPPRSERTVVVSNRGARLLCWLCFFALLSGLVIFISAILEPGFRSIASPVILLGAIASAVVVCVAFLYLALLVQDFALAPGFIQLPFSKGRLLDMGWWKVEQLRLVAAVRGDEHAKETEARLRELLPTWPKLEPFVRSMLVWKKSGGLLVVFPDRAQWYVVDISRVTPESAGFSKLEAHWRAGAAPSRSAESG